MIAIIELGYSKNKGSDQRVFIGQRGAMTPRGIESTLKKYVKQSDLEEVSPHQLRHTFCKNLIDAGVSLEKVATLAGHDNLETTRRYCIPSEQGGANAPVPLHSNGQNANAFAQQP